jgi:hypothetical protein
MRVASLGNVVVHEIAPGGLPEPTMIYLDDDRLPNRDRKHHSSKFVANLGFAA